MVFSKRNIEKIGTNKSEPGLLNQKVKDIERNKAGQSNLLIKFLNKRERIEAINIVIKK